MVRREKIGAVIVPAILMFPVICLLGHWGIVFSRPGHAGEWSQGALRAAFNFSAIWMAAGAISELSGLTRKFEIWGKGTPAGR